MGIEALIDITKKNFKKKFGKDRDLEVHSGLTMPPPTGLIVDNPLLEFILDQRFLAYGRCYLTYGKKGNSKTSLFFDIAKTFQRSHPNAQVIWVETEKAADLSYAKKQGVDLDRLYMPEVHTLQEALTFIEDCIKSLPKAFPDGDTPVLICLDSIAGVCPEYELQDSVTVGETKVGEHARLMAGFYRRICDPLSTEKAIFFALNQLKDIIGGGPSFGEKGEALIGGEAQRFHSTYQLKVVRTKDLLGPDPESGAERKVGSRHEITCKRNKLGREGNSQKVEFDLYIEGGIDWYSPLVRKLGEEYKKLVTKTGGWYNWNIPNVNWIDPKTGEPVVIDTEKDFRESQLGYIIKNSPEAKELIRDSFKINPLPPQEEVRKIEEDNKKKRGKRKKADPGDEGYMPPEDTL